MLTLILAVTYSVHYISSSQEILAQTGFVHEEPYKKWKAEKDATKLTLHFSKNSFLISKPDQLQLQKTAEYLLKNPKLNVFIHAHSWDGGNEGQELLLSEKRSLEVFRFFIIHNVKEEQIQRLFYGNSKPLPYGFTSTDQAIQRRVEIVVEPQDQ